VVAVERLQAGEIDLVSSDGTLLNSVSANLDDPNVGPVPMGVGETGVYLYYPATGAIDLLGLTGPPQDVGQTTPNVSGGSSSLAGLAESPNGECWIFSLVSWTYGGSADSATSQLYVGGIGSSPLLVATLDRTVGYQVLSWDASGVLLGTELTGIGGGPAPFTWTDGVDLQIVVDFDPVTGDVSTPLCSTTTDSFRDIAPGGTVACAVQGTSDAEIQVRSPDGSITTIPTGSPLAGHVRFVDGTSLLTYCTSDDQEVGDTQFTEDLWSVEIGSATPSPQMLMTGDLSWCEGGVVAGTSSIAELGGGADTTSIVLINLSSGQTTTVAPADELLGVL